MFLLSQIFQLDKHAVKAIRPTLLRMKINEILSSGARFSNSLISTNFSLDSRNAIFFCEHNLVIFSIKIHASVVFRHYLQRVKITFFIFHSVLSETCSKIF